MIHSFIHLYINSSVRHASIHPCIYSFPIHLFIHSSIRHSSIYSFIHAAFIHSSIHLLNYSSFSWTIHPQFVFHLIIHHFFRFFFDWIIFCFFVVIVLVQPQIGMIILLHISQQIMRRVVTIIFWKLINIWDYAFNFFCATDPKPILTYTWCTSIQLFLFFVLSIHTKLPNGDIKFP